MTKKYPRVATIKGVDRKGLTLDQRLEKWREYKHWKKVRQRSTNNWERAVANRMYAKYGMQLGMIKVQLLYLQKKLQEKKREQNRRHR